MVCTISGTTIIAGVTNNLYIGNTDAYNISLVALTDNKVFIIYRENSSYLYGLLCAIDGTSIQVQNRILIRTQSDYGHVVKLSENNVFIYYANGTNRYYLYGNICKIDGTTITVGTKETTLYTGYNINAQRQSAVLYNKVFMTYVGSPNAGTNSSPYAMTCTIGETTPHATALQDINDDIKGVAKTSGLEKEMVQIIVPNIESEEN